jgi:hypothetical protein
MCIENRLKFIKKGGVFMEERIEHMCIHPEACDVCNGNKIEDTGNHSEVGQPNQQKNFRKTRKRRGCYFSG